MARFRTIAAGAALALALVACGSDDATTSTAAPETASDETASTAPPITGSFATVAGGQLDLGALEGQDTVLWFWAPW